ncbi:MAG: HAMP domain-containing protein [Gammaproteobacteria bacterium]|nr:HAMP domain-containing protein [Gammaproteobacteria bacterium]MBU2057068.1 HAMP domain-containing protein [Gammaproteobacteria bacterium]MBU2175127.1 HAMP domain-containing protein [Gammaproteobacteria bacterium]MBU2245158.1 HAMP domain-containing protein [Gammaproteobacteria bacterium]MBU2343975.1 HAMP domain-containing protein [Gammaproteobacteria bacterium]
MYRFFRRIFLSVWVIIVTTALLTSVVAQWLPEGATKTSPPFYKRMAENVAIGIRKQLQQHQTIDAQSLQREYILDAENVIQIYVFSPDGKELLGRKYNLDRDLSALHDEDGIAVIRKGLDGYTVIGVRNYFPIAKLLITPWARLTLLITALAVSIIVSLALSHFIVQPIRLIREAGQKVASGDLSISVAHHVAGRRDDIAMLAKDFDLMTEKIYQLLERQKRLMRDVSHELRSPLARLQALFSLCRQKLDQQNGKLDIDYIDRMEVESERLNLLIERILVFTRLESFNEINRHTTDLIDLLNVIAEDASIEGFAQNKDVLVIGEEKCILKLDSALIQSAFENIIRNALRYTEINTNVIVRVFNTPKEITIEICDSGPGVPEQDLTSLFEPFFRVEAARTHSMGGGGIGLAIAQRAVQLHGGTITAENRDEGGLKVIVTLPNTIT